MRFSKAASVLTCVISSQVHAQWSSQFGVPGANRDVYALIMHDDGGGPALYAAGAFEGMDNQACGRIARLRNGAWSSVGSGLGAGRVRAMTVFNGELVAAGLFPDAGGVPVNNIAHWNGTTWQAFGGGLPVSSSGEVTSLTVYNGQLIAGGHNLTLGSGIARWNGSTWQAMGAFNNVQNPRPVIVYNGQLITWAPFINQQSGNVLRWTGTQWETIGALDGSVSQFAVYNGDLIAAGGFTTIGGVSANRIARWNGTSWQPLAEGGYSGPLAVHNGTLIVGQSDILAVWNGQTWTTVQHGLTTDLPSIGGGVAGVGALLSFEDSSGPVLIIGGTFTGTELLHASNLARFANGQISRLTE